MYQLKITDMTCGHCASMVNKAIKALDQNASVEINLNNQEVTINSVCELSEIMEVLDEAGYPAVHQD